MDIDNTAASGQPPSGQNGAAAAEGATDALRASAAQRRHVAPAPPAGLALLGVAAATAASTADADGDASMPAAPEPALATAAASSAAPAAPSARSVDVSAQSQQPATASGSSHHSAITQQPGLDTAASSSAAAASSSAAADADGDMAMRPAAAATPSRSAPRSQTGAESAALGPAAASDGASTQQRAPLAVLAPQQPVVDAATARNALTTMKIVNKDWTEGKVRALVAALDKKGWQDLTVKICDDDIRPIMASISAAAPSAAAAVSASSVRNKLLQLQKLLTWRQLADLVGYKAPSALPRLPTELKAVEPRHSAGRRERAARH
jgi:hypothetical protein